ncbi:MAG: hypothetical protein GY909_05070 [Oligoflexia bacterium]|nr:hypothetical protein [Oligoflexia bacterium]
MKPFVKKLCFSSEGKGRITVPDGRYLVDYESFHDVANKKWIIGLDIPLQGEEVLELHYGKRLRLSGSFSKRLAGIRNNKKLANAFSKFLISLSELLQIHNDQSLEFKNKPVISNEELTYKFGSQYQLKIQGQRNKGSHFGRMNFLLLNSKMAKPETSIELFVSSCTQ